MSSSLNLFRTEWFAQQKEFTMELESMKIEEMNNYLSKFYLSARRQDGSYCKKTSLLSIRAALDRHLRSPPFNNCKKVSICDTVQFNEANKALNSYLKHLASSGKIAGTVHKTPLTAETVQKLFEAGELASAETRNPRLLLQTTWFYISLYFGKRGRENQSAMKKSMLRLAVTPSGEEYFELNKDEPGAVLSTKNHTGGLDGTEDHADGKIFASPYSSRCPLQTVKAYLSHLHPEVDALFQRPKDISLRFDPEKDKIWFERKVLGHNSLENMMRNMTERAGILPYYTNHSLRATTVTVLSSNNVETRQIKAVTGHKSDASIESYCERPTLHQFKSMSSALTSFIQGGKTRHQRPLHPIQSQVQQLSQEIQPRESSQCQPTAYPLVKTKKTFSCLTELIHKPFCHQGISKDAHSLSISI